MKNRKQKTTEQREKTCNYELNAEHDNLPSSHQNVSPSDLTLSVRDQFLRLKLLLPELSMRIEEPVGLLARKA